MTAKALRNPALRTKFKVGDVAKFPKEVWSKLTPKMVMHTHVSGTVLAIGDKIIERGKNKLCRFAVILDSPELGKVEVWEEWMLDKLVLMYATQEVSKPTNCTTCGQPTPG